MRWTDASALEATISFPLGSVSQFISHTESYSIHGRVDVKSWLLVDQRRTDSPKALQRMPSGITSGNLLLGSQFSSRYGVRPCWICTVGTVARSDTSSLSSGHPSIHTLAWSGPIDGPSLCCVHLQIRCRVLRPTQRPSGRG